MEKDIALLLVFLWPPGVQFSVIFQYQFLISYLSYTAALRHFNSRPKFVFNCLSVPQILGHKHWVVLYSLHSDK